MGLAFGDVCVAGAEVCIDDMFFLSSGALLCDIRESNKVVNLIMNRLLFGNL